MSLQAVDADTATRTYDCHEQDCEGVALSNRGPYAYLCETHKREKQERRVSERPVLAPLKSGTPASFEGRAKELAAIGRKLDRALDKLQPAKETARQAMAEWKAALERLAQ